MLQSMNFRRTALSLVMLPFAVITSVASVKADTVTLQFNTGNGGSLPDGNYGTVTLTLNATGGIDVNISLLNGAKIINGGQDCSICFDSSLPSLPVIGATIFGLEHYALINTNPGSLHADGFGFFEYGVNYIGAGSGGGCTQCLSGVTFTVTDAAHFASVFDLSSGEADKGG